MSEISAGESSPQRTDLTGDALLQAIRKQVEFYFSPSNLSIDKFLVSQMDPQMFVPLQVIANFKKVQFLTKDIAQIVASLNGSTDVILDETGTRIRPNMSNKRHTLIIRDIPTSTPEAEVIAIFNQPGAPRVVSVRSEVGNNWFCEFEDEESTMRALDWSRNSGLFNGEPIKARVKSESILKGSFTPSFFAANAALPLYAPMQAPLGANARGFARRPDSSGGRGRRVVSGGRPQQPGGPYTSGPSQGQGIVYAAPTVPFRGGAAAGGSDGSAKQQKRKDGSLRISKPRGEGSAPVPLSPLHFPPLPNKVAGSEKTGRPITKYGVSEMQEMFRRLSPALPNGVDTDCPVVLSVPETVLEQDRPDGERRCSIELEKRRAGARVSTGSHVEGIKEEGDVLAEAAAAVAEVEHSSAAVDSGAAVSPTSAPRSYASLVPTPSPSPTLIAFVFVTHVLQLKHSKA